MMMALTMTFSDEPMAKNMSFRRQYAEPYDWVAQQLKDWAFNLSTSFFYYNDPLDDDSKQLLRQSMKAFGGIAPPTILSYWTSPRFSGTSILCCWGFK